MINSKIFIPSFSVILVGLIGCASTKQYVPLPDQNVQIEDTTKARIYVVRPTSFGAAISMDIFDSGKHIGVTGPYGYLCWERDTGKALVSGSSENTSTLPIAAEKGKTYYIDQGIRMGFVVARNKLTLLDEKEGKEELKKCKKPKIENNTTK